ncbi:hypothetical protein ANT_30240 [Anaerolinea thermophila UNI-1]|uniref:Uncharacterized protein n=1 Tax=Anaerolinea thermophila (strain DSM 14523 / JCM 11388 / NBRC 100420 / UNI-1) TaxID=926569 RepID=E8N2A3_ANATU|nr:hypothetical protein ANT_30240 [Anaerolinea thermophila UNI-1]
MLIVCSVPRHRLLGKIPMRRFTGIRELRYNVPNAGMNEGTAWHIH